MTTKHATPKQPPTAREELAARKAERAKQRDEREDAKAAQSLLDLDAIEALEAEHGAEHLGQIEVKWSPGFPTVIAVRTPREVEMKYFRAKAKGTGNHDGDMPGAQEDLANVCRVYPDKELFDRICTAYPTLRAIVAQECIMLAAGQSDARVKL